MPTKEMTKRDEKVVQYLNDAYATERRLEIALQAHIAMTPRADYKKRLREHLKETKAHKRQVASRIKKLGGKSLNDRHEVTPADPSKPQSYFEVKCVGPEDQVIDVSNAGWVGAK